MADEDVLGQLDRHRYASAFELLMERYQSRVFRSVTSVVREAARAEEVTQDVFLKVWRALPEYDGRASLSTWIYTIARNTALSSLRAESYRRTLPLEDCEPQVALDEAPLQRAEIDQFLNRLPDVQREVLTLFYLQDRNVEDVAQMLDLPTGTVKSHLHRARRALAGMMRS